MASASDLRCGFCGTGITPGPLGDICPVCLLRDGCLENVGTQPDLPAGRDPVAPLFPRPFGGYDLLNEIAHGGMGVVYRARHQVLGREVALKLLLAGRFASPDSLTRFRREGVAAASLRHPNIVGVYEVGEVEGQPFLAMEYVDGTTLSERVQEHPLAPETAAKYMLAVTRAVEHAHTHGLLHRDLKPSNVIIGLDDVPRVTDFGLAKRLDGTTDVTMSGQVLGSPHYLSPEAALGRDSLLTPASDVYSLGATLYHLLTGRPPFVAGSVVETLVQVREQPVAAPRLLNTSIPRDLETICLKCLEKEPSRRYRTAGELADELTRWIEGRPIRARPATAAERAWKWMRRNPARAAVGATVAVSVAAMVLASLWFNLHLNRARNEAERNRRQSETNRMVAEANAAASQDRLVRMDVITGNRYVAEGDPLVAALWFVEALRTESQSAAPELALRGHRRRLAAAWGSAPRLVDCVDTGFDRPFASVFVTKAPLQEPRVRLKASGAGMGVVRADGSRVSFGDPDAGTADPEVLPGSRDALDVELSADGIHVLVFARDGSHQVWKVTTGRPLTPPITGDGFRVRPRINPDGRTWAYAYEASGQWFLASRSLATPAAAPTLVNLDSQVFELQFDPAGRWIATAHWDGSVHLWSAATLQPAAAPLRHHHGVATLAFSPDGSRLATGGWGREVRIWRVPDGTADAPPLHFGTELTHLEFSRDGRYILAQGNRKSALVWDLYRPDPTPLDGLTAGTHLLRAGANGSVAAWDSEGTGHFWTPTATGTEPWFQHVEARDGGTVEPSVLELSTDGQLAVTATETGHIDLWNLRTGERIRTYQHGKAAIHHAAISPDNQWVASASDDGWVRLSSNTGGEQPSRTLRHGHRARRVAFSPDSQRIATCGYDREVKVWDLSGGDRLATIAHDRDVAMVAYSPDGSRLLTGMSDGSHDPLAAQMWETRTHQPLGAPMLHTDPVGQVMFFRGGARILTRSEESLARVWNGADGSPQSPWIRCGRRILNIDASPDGQMISTVDETGIMRVWDADSGEQLSASPAGGSVSFAVFAGPGRIVYGGLRGPLRLRALPEATGSVEMLAEKARLHAALELDATGGLSPILDPRLPELFERFKSTNPSDYQPVHDAPEWHRQELSRAKLVGDEFAAAFHRNALAGSSTNLPPR